ncbi:hypothetical protein C2845_PM08G15110 [Panicum miliaceum]|uniref:Uncharacterized protein n=1 Tax=Panicum miliaceum TaxID=4540 RepID=A0A3L6R3M6_PANMI|nr:hypothetical protein C2845_PM08G15110 [Panicum miliaceum]
MMPCCDMRQIEELFEMIKKHRDAGVTGVSVMYTWLGRRIQPLEKRTHFGFENIGISYPSRFFAEHIEKECGEDEEGTDDDCTLAEVIKGKKTKTAQEGQSSPGGDPLPSHPKGPRAATRKSRASPSPGGAEDEIPK